MATSSNGKISWIEIYTAPGTASHVQFEKISGVPTMKVTIKICAMSDAKTKNECTTLHSLMHACPSKINAFRNNSNEDGNTYLYIRQQ
jgi:hypothetical protein